MKYMNMDGYGNDLKLFFNTDLTSIRFIIKLHIFLKIKKLSRESFIKLSLYKTAYFFSIS